MFKKYLLTAIALFTFVSSAFAVNWSGNEGFDKGKFPADQVTTDVSNFSGNLSSADTDVQKALNTLDNLIIPSSGWTTTGDQSSLSGTKSGTYNLSTTGTLGAGVGTLAGNNANAAFTLLNLNNNVTPTTGQTGHTSDLVFNLTQSVNSVASLHEAAKISAYKVSDWFHASTEADVDSGLKLYTTKDGTPILQLTIDEAGLATFVGNVSAASLVSSGNITTGAGATLFADYISDTNNTQYLAYWDGEAWIMGTLFAIHTGTLGTDYINSDNTNTVVFNSFIGGNIFTTNATHSPLTQGEGPLTGNINNINTIGADNDVVTLPALTSADYGYRIIVMNSDSAQVLKVWAASGDKIDGADYDTIGVGVMVEYISYDATNWKSHTIS